MLFNKHYLKNGVSLGCLAGLVVTFFEGFYMLNLEVYVPASYPFWLTIFNISFWTIVGFLWGGASFVIFKKIKWDQSALYYSGGGFLILFASIYAFLGLINPNTPFVPGKFIRGYDNYASIFCAFSIVLFFFIQKKRLINKVKSPAHFTVEIIVITYLYHVGHNIDIISFNSVNSIISSIFNPDRTMPLADIVRLHNSLMRYFSWTAILLGMAGYGFYAFKLDLKLNNSFKVITVAFTLVSFSLFLFYSLNTLSHRQEPDLSKNIGGRQSMPNVILIVLDTLRADYTSVYNSDVNTTPNLKSFSHDAVVFKNCIAASSWTLPSHASIFTGVYPTEHGSHNNIERTQNPRTGDFKLGNPLPEKFLTLAEIFQQHSYQTACITANFAVMNKANKLNQGFDIYSCSKSIGALYQNHFQPIFVLFNWLTSFKTKFYQPYRVAEEINKTVFPLIGLYSRKETPFFMFINYMDAHVPYAPPQPFSNKYTRTLFPNIKRILPGHLFSGNKYKQVAAKLYKGEIAYADEHLGKLFKYLKSKGLYNSSLIIITADHGELFWSHGLYMHACEMYEGVVQVPLIIKYPNSAKTGSEGGLVSISDIFPTILDICKAPIPDGTSGTVVGKKRSEPVVAEYFNHKFGRQRILYDENYKLMTFEKNRDSELYNWVKDKSENNDLTGQLPKLQEKLQAKLQIWDENHTLRYKLKKGIEISPGVRQDLKALGYLQ